MEALNREIYLKHREYRKDKITHKEWSNFLAKGKAEVEGFELTLHRVIETHTEAHERLRKYLSSPLYKYRIRKYCNLHLYSDIMPFEVVNVKSKTTVEIRRMDSVLIKAPSMEPGGFVGHYENDEQEWSFSSNETYPTKIVRLTKNGWGCGNFLMSDKPIRLHDYNF